MTQLRVLQARHNVSIATVYNYFLGLALRSLQALTLTVKKLLAINVRIE